MEGPEGPPFGGPPLLGPGGPDLDGPGGPPPFFGPPRGGPDLDGPGGPDLEGPGGPLRDGPGGPDLDGPGGPFRDCSITSSSSSSSKIAPQCGHFGSDSLTRPSQTSHANISSSSSSSAPMVVTSPSFMHLRTISTAIS